MAHEFFQVDSMVILEFSFAHCFHAEFPKLDHVEFWSKGNGPGVVTATAGLPNVVDRRRSTADAAALSGNPC